MGTDRDKMNRAVFATLKPGGEFIVVDHSAKDGDGIADVKTFHRIEESVVRAEVAKAGFNLAKEGSFLLNASDTRVAAGNRRGTSDRFVLAFVKP